MLKPIVPRKPRKNDVEPSPTLRVDACVYMINKELKLLTDEEFDELKKQAVDPDDYCNLDWSLEDRISISDLNKLVSELPEGTTNVSVTVEYISYNTSGLCVEYITPKSGEEYKKELDAFKNRFKTYEIEYGKYQKELVKYEAYIKARKISRLKKELKNLKG